MPVVWRRECNDSNGAAAAAAAAITTTTGGHAAAKCDGAVMMAVACVCLHVPISWGA